MATSYSELNIVMVALFFKSRTRDAGFLVKC